MESGIFETFARTGSRSKILCRPDSWSETNGSSSGASLHTGNRTDTGCPALLLRCFGYSTDLRATLLGPGFRSGRWNAETLQRLGKTVETEKFSQLQWCSEFDDQKYKAILGLKESGISPSESAVWRTTNGSKKVSGRTLTEWVRVWLVHGNLRTPLQSPTLPENSCLIRVLSRDNVFHNPLIRPYLEDHPI